MWEAGKFRGDVCVLDLPSLLTILPAIVATIPDEKLQMDRLYIPQYYIFINRRLCTAIFHGATKSPLQIAPRTEETRGGRVRRTSVAPRRGGRNFFLVKYGSSTNSFAFFPPISGTSERDRRDPDDRGIALDVSGNVNSRSELSLARAKRKRRRRATDDISLSTGSRPSPGRSPSSSLSRTRLRRPVLAVHPLIAHQGSVAYRNVTGIQKLARNSDVNTGIFRRKWH